MAELMGSRFAIASVGLPGHLADFVRALPEERRERAIDRLIDANTLFPFHSAFMPEEIRDEGRRAMRDDVTGVYTRLGLAAFKVRPPERLRFCPTCIDEMEAEHGDAWWCRAHQLPGIGVCHIHDDVLRLSEVDPGDMNRHSFVAASRETCRADAPPALIDATDEDLARLRDLARLAAGLLTSPPPPRGFAEQADTYRSRLADVGLMRSARKVDHAALAAAFRARWGRVPELVPGLELNDDHERSWLAALVRTGRRAAHPLQHLMLGAMLDGMASVPVARPFGSGPWPCRNPAAGHHGETVIASVTMRRDRGTIYGDFACGCGYLYTRSRSTDGVIGEPKFRRFGPLLAPALKAAVGRGDSLRLTARTLGLDPKTLMREAAIAGVPVPWSLSPSGAIPTAREKDVQPKALRQPRRARPTRNWFAIDTRLARSVRHGAATIHGERPPVRATWAELERRISRRDWVVKRKAKLPQTVAAMEAAIESVDRYRERRLAWQIGLAFAAADMRPCEILRDAGLPMSWLPRVRVAVDDWMIRGRSVA